MGTQQQEMREGQASLYFGETTITEIDGKRGRQAHRGYPIEDLVNYPYEYLVYLLLQGSWPTHEQYSTFIENLLPYRDLPEDLGELIARQKDAPAGVVLQTSFSYLSGTRDVPDIALLSLAPSIAVAHNALKYDRAILPPDPSLGIAADCLRRLLGRPITDLEVEIINTDFVLHADHGANASAFVARIATSADADMYRCLVAALAAFSGVRHGGAITGIADMLDVVALEDIPSFVRQRNETNAPVLGFGHGVNIIDDPRSGILLKAAEDLSRAKMDLSLLEKVNALVDSMAAYGSKPDIDLYAALIYRLLGLEPDQLTILPAIARLVGWMAQIQEQRNGSNMLIRPRLRYVGGEASI